MHILMFSWEYPPHLVGGLGRHVADLLPALAHHTHVAVTLVTPGLRGGPPLEQIAPRIRIVRLTDQIGDPEYDLTEVTRINRLLEQVAMRLHHQTTGFDLVHCHDWLTAQVGLAVSQKLRLPLVTTIHATEQGRWQGRIATEHSRRIDQLERRLVHGTQQVVVCSHYMAQQLEALLTADPTYITVIPNAVYRPTNPFQHVAEQRTYRSRYAAANEHLVFFIGRLVYEKGVQVLIEAWAQLQHQYAGQLVIAGTGPDADLCKQRGAELGLQERVQFRGRISDAERDRFYHAADVAVFPSIYEPFGIVALEAMAAGCPVVATRTGGLQEIIEPHETGILVEPDHVDALAWGLRHTLAHPNWARARARNALRTVEQRYSWRRVAEQHLQLYTTLQQEWQAQLQPVLLPLQTRRG